MKKRSIITTLVSVVIFTAIVSLCIYFQETRRVEEIRFVCSVNDSTNEQISLHCLDGDYYAFLPAYADLTATKITLSKGYTLYIDGQEYNSDADCSFLTCDQKYAISIKNSFGLSVSNANLIIKKASNIPTLSLHLSDGTLENLQKDKNNSTSGTALLITEDNTIDYLGLFNKLHGRGNSTWSQPKKSFSLEFETETDLLGMGAGTNWVLMANALDESSLRNKLVYDTAQALELPYACSSSYVNLYVDSEYQGLYLLTENITVGTNRVNITDLHETTQAVNQFALSNYQQVEKNIDGKIQLGYDIPHNPSDITGGYLLQIKHHNYPIEGNESLVSTDILYFTLSYPKYASKEQVAYIFDYMNNLESQIIAGDLSGIDIDSFALLYMLQEYFANYDNCSVYFFKDSDQIDSKLYAGPIWDMDLSMGNGSLPENIEPDVIYRGNDNWFNYLLDCEQFTQRLQQLYWDEFRPNMDRLIYQRLQEYKVLIESSFHMDKLRWKGVVPDNDWGDVYQKRFDTLGEHIDRIEVFLRSRTEYFDGIWGDQEGYHLLSFTSGVNYYKKFYVKDQDTLDITPTPSAHQDSNDQFIGWFDEDGNEFDPNSAVTENASYTARWEKAVIEQTPFLSSETIRSIVSPKLLLFYVICAGVFGFLLVDIVQEAKRKRCKNGE